MTTILDAEGEERDNFFRLTLLLFRLGNTKLREYLKSKWPAVYLKANPGSTPTAWSDTPPDAVALKTISKPKFRFKDQETAFDSGDTNTWDFTLLRLVLTTYPLGFVVKPSAEDDALEDLRVIRNTLIGHATDARISNAVFNTEWLKACRALGRFNATQDEFDAVEEDVKKPIDTLIPLLKECIKSEKEILDSITEFEKKAEKWHEDVMEKLDNHHDDNIKVIKEEGLQTRKAIIEEINKPKPPEIRHLLMPDDQRHLLQQRLPHFQDDVMATDLLDNLPCLTQEQKDQITNHEKNFQLSKGVRTLVEKLEEHEEGFGQFVQALGKADLGHVAVILDPDFKSHAEEEEEEEDIPHFSIEGTAADSHILVRIWNDMKVRQTDLEERVASQYGKSSSTESRRLRRYFEKELPQGVYFVRTTQLGARKENAIEKTKDDSTKGKKDSVVFVFRVAKVKALDELWDMYSDYRLKQTLTEVLTSRAWVKDPCERINLETLFQEKDYMERREKLKGPEFIEESELSVEGIADELMDLDVTGTEKPAQRRKILSQVYLGDIPKRELQLREYQKELAAPALEGKNTIICAPTNSGKTFVAMEIAKRHLDAYKDSQNEASKNVSRPKVIFVVDKQNLVLQQRARFEEYLTNYNISDISGSNSDVVPLHRMIQDNDVIVLTTQILVNAMIDKSVSISDISLLVFDECHHANKDHPYNQIMQEYLDLKIKKNIKYLPQVVGLTASLGVGKSITKDKAIEHILQMCANLDASNISTVRENIDELITHVTGHVPVKRMVPHVNHDTQNVFEIEINKTMQEIELFVNKLRSNVSSPQTGPPTDRQVESYRQWIELLQNDREISDNRTKFTCADQLRKYHEALLINNTVRIDDAIKYLTDYFDNLDPSKFTENCTVLQELYKQTMQRIQNHIHEYGKPDNPLLKGLEKLIIEFHEKNEETEAKGILFTRTRDYTVALKRWIMETEELKMLKPEVLVGSGDGDIGLSQTQQEAVIKKFKTGEVNIIIATTVAEEGLDISDCSYVIRYGMLGNEISSVQSRGRIRAKEGNYVYMPDSRRRGVDHEIRNDYREMLMESAIVEVQEMDKSLFLERVNGIQKQGLDELELKNQMEASFKSQFEDKDHISFLCKKCETYVCSSRDIRRYKKTNHLVVNPNVEKLYIVKERNKPEGHRGRFNEHKVHCKECDLDWGILLLTKGANWFCMKIKSFWVVIDSSERRQIKNWKDVPFTIEEVALDKLFELRKLLGQNQDEC